MTKFLVLSCVVLTFATSPFTSTAQEADSEPIYLDEPEPEPMARVAARQTLKETYESKSPRAVRDVAKLSDDRIVNDGKYVEFYRDGQKYVEGNYKMGVFDGDWTYWFSNGQVCKKTSFKDGQGGRSMGGFQRGRATRRAKGLSRRQTPRQVDQLPRRR